MDRLVQHVVVACVVLLVLTALFVAARIYAKLLIIRTIGLDDVLIIFAWICSIAMATAVIEEFQTYLKLQIAASCLYSCGVPAAKASFAVLYLRLLPKMKYRILNYFLCVFLVGQAIEEILVVVLNCRPIAKSWDPSMPGACNDLRVLWWATFIFNIFTDLALFIQPIPSMWQLQMPLTKRVGLIAMLSLGLLVTSISVIRIVYVTRIGADVTYELADPLIWSVAELCALIICSCIPSLRQVVKKIPGLNSALGLSNSGGNSKTYYGNNSRQKGISIHLHSRGRKDYMPATSQKSRATGRSQSRAYGTTSHVEALRHVGEHNESQDEIFPHKTTQEGDVIMVTREVVRQESDADAHERRKRSDAALGDHFEGADDGSLHSFHKPQPAYHP
ncbi:hypothetical protein Micbo1qcDRAFT_218837 [Microdochium bolleyi]|uniref:Rhodopsin domain-containing protein n=1 Tax=Microdochium bolleyi TaxID=196109 RepID=A0A136IP19_9PEZI|nr:hypothetical protein Micbo1qcDRAFT_218837 [Microdochium bolleyi]